MDLGVHLLRDLSEPERLFCVIHPTLTRPEIARVISLSTFQHDLPSRTPSFTGREKGMPSVLILPQNPATRPVTITGSGDTGETRLALQAFATIFPGCPDGALLVPLADLGDPQRLIAFTASALGSGFYRS
ncbi:MAG: hypothetical protein V2G50_00095 [bacterium JZ-2024 1]